MPFPYDAGDLAAIDRLANFYNGGDYNASTNPGGMGRGGHRVNFENALADAARVGAANAAAATAAGTSATNAGESAAAAALSAAKLIGSSGSGVAIETGSKAFVTQAGKFFAPGAFVMIYSAANPTVNYMAGQVTAYSGTDLTVDVTVTKGSGTFSDWVIAVAGAPGGQGNPGLQGPVGPTPDIMVTFSDGVTDSDPGNGLLKFNNAAPGSTTQIYVDNLDRYGTSIASWLDSFDDSTNTALRGTVKLVQVSDPTKYARFNVVGAVVDGGGYRKIAVAHVLSSGTFSNGAILAIDFVRTGNAGLNGDGAGDVLGPAVSTDNHVALFDGITGKLLKGGGALAPVALSGQASHVSVTPTGSLGASSVQAALAELDDEKQPLNATLTALAGVTTTAFGRARLADADAAAARAALSALSLSGGTLSGALNHRVGSGQQTIRTLGSSAGNQRVAELLEASGGLSIYTYDSSGASAWPSLILENRANTFNVQNGAVAGNSAGQVVIPGQPAFSVYLTSDLPIGNGNGVIVMGSALLNRSSLYNLSTGRFTAPVAGAYAFHGVLQYADGTANTGSLGATLSVNGGTRHAVTVAKGGFYEPVILSLVVQLAAGDYVELRYTMSGAAGSPALQNFNTRLSGHLIG